MVSWLLKEGFLHKYKSEAFLVRFEVGLKRDWQKRRDFYSDSCYIVYRFILIIPFSFLGPELCMFLVFKVID